MLNALKMAIVSALLIVSASTALAQRTPIDSQSLTAPLDYGPVREHERNRLTARPQAKRKLTGPIRPVIFFSIYSLVNEDAAWDSQPLSPATAGLFFVSAGTGRPD